MAPLVMVHSERASLVICQLALLTACGQSGPIGAFATHNVDQGGMIACASSRWSQLSAESLQQGHERKPSVACWSIAPLTVRSRLGRKLETARTHVVRKGSSFRSERSPQQQCMEVQLVLQNWSVKSLAMSSHVLSIVCLRNGTIQESALQLVALGRCSSAAISRSLLHTTARPARRP